MKFALPILQWMDGMEQLSIKAEIEKEKAEKEKTEEKKKVEEKK